MIRKRTEVKKAFCDACGAKLSSDCQENDDKTPRDVHYGKLVNEFGYGSDLDGIDNVTSSLDLCGECYKKCFVALGIPLSQWQVPVYHLFVAGEHRLLENDAPFNGEVGKEIYYLHGWGCRLCGWRDIDHGLKIPDHECGKKKQVDARRDELCEYCAGKHPEFNFDPHYYGDGKWIHIPILSSNDERPLCGANEFMQAIAKDVQPSDEPS